MPKKAVEAIELKEPKDTTHPKRVRKHRVHGSSKFNYDFVKMAARLKAAGFTDNDLAYAFDVTSTTVRTWQKKHPEFALACSKGKEAASRYLVAQALRAAAGYDYTETDAKYRAEQYTDEEGVEQTKEVLIGKTVKDKHQKSDPFLLTFMLINLSDGEFKNTKYIETTMKSITANVDIRAELTGEEIRKVAGKFLDVAESVEKKQIESVIINEVK